ncbi:L-seryl-tRNA(Sec) selenium transferase [Thermovenabulum gondwanense]|uniref:L-seryl-tRNA(Sec) selenium transferase n=1 Tax=Thermovenabulum gondwanense TaxID=520767 RepID=A0A162M9T3_9FIRM|nr:L-seryl-tRNA(Sec) selenium transferase [Thermovenabulum gondwanense]KYO64744.1 L-seryl-tRNA(Sec) selenium transferase [Thermovenabulum gondwanense]
MSLNDTLRKLPKIGDLIERPEIRELVYIHGKKVVLKAAREAVNELRGHLILLETSQPLKETLTEENLIKEAIKIIVEKLEEYKSFSLKKVINATGVVLHTNLGRAPLPKEVLENINNIASGYSNLEFDLDEGERGERYSHVKNLLMELTGAEDAMVVNNNAGAVLLCLSALSKGKEVIVSRGELIEIGGSFRIPDVMLQSGAKLVEVGTTNKTHLYDYERAINENTSLLMKVHTSNYRIIGFTSGVERHELKKLAEKYNLVFMEDLGSGVLVDLRKYGIPYEPTVQDSVKAGVDVVTFSGDKLLGGPQAGIIVGRREIIEKVKKHPLNRALRIDKLTLASMEAILKIYLEGNIERIPVIKMISKDLETLKRDAEKLAEGLNSILKEKGSAVILDDLSEVGGGSLPGVQMPTKVVALRVCGLEPEEISKKLRSAKIPVIGRINKNEYLLDVRTMNEEDIFYTIDMVGKIIWEI